MTTTPAHASALRSGRTMAEVLPADVAGIALRAPGREPITYAALRHAVREIAGGLAALGVESGDRVAILSATRPEWMLADIGALTAGALVVPVYHTNSHQECRYVPYLVALVTLDPDERPALAREIGLTAIPKLLTRDVRVHEPVWKEIDAVNQRFARIEQVKRFAILPRDFTPPDSELTPTLKVKRNVISSRFARVIERIYAKTGQ